MKTSFRKVFYWSLGSHLGLLLLLGVMTLIVSCKRKEKIVPHVFTLQSPPPAERVAESKPKAKPVEQKPVPKPVVKKKPPPVVKKDTPPKKEPKKETKPVPTESYEDFLKKNPPKKKDPEPVQPSHPQQPAKDPLKDIRDELKTMMQDTQSHSQTSENDLKALQRYMGQLSDQINVLWDQPEGLPAGEWLAHVEFTVSGNGKISKVRFVKRSGNTVFDDSIVHAMNQFHSTSPPPDHKTHTFELPFRIVMR